MLPGTWRVWCPLCSYEQQSAGSIRMVVRDDGTEAICPEPDALRIAEETTGKRWDELEAAGRIRTRVAQFCLACGVLDFYPVDSDRVTFDLVPDLCPARRARPAACRSCGRARLAVLAEAAGCLGALFERFLAPRCPLCKEGRLQRASVSPE